MSWKTFTPEELVKIRQNPYVKSATAHMIRFTSLFKEEFWEQIERGMKPTDIIRSMGFDPEVLGESRISGIKIYPIEWTAKSVETRIVDRKKGLRNIEILERGHKKV